MPKAEENGAQERAHDKLSGAIARVLFPVMLCMGLAVYLVHSMGDAQQCEDAQRRGEFVTLLPGGSDPAGSSSAGPYDGTAGVIFVAIFGVCIVLFTFVLFFLYKHGCIKVIFGWLFFSVCLIFAYVGGSYVYEFCRSHCINMDWITFAFVVWNFTITGLLAIFSTVPRLVNQGYLIVMSALMAFIFRKLPEWTTWTILGLLSLWDLFAVLTPWGPLRKLVEIAQDRGDPLPALVYDTNPHAVGRDDEAQPAVVFPTAEEKKAKKQERENRKAAKEQAGIVAAEVAASSTVPADSPNSNGGNMTESRAAGKGNIAERMKRKRKKSANQMEEGENVVRPAQDPNSGERVGTLGHHLKLGLGDFVFYSILVAQASQRGAMTAITSFVAILAGLCATLFLVTVYRKALPALPISIVLGLVFYFLTRYTIQPLTDVLFQELLYH